MSRICIVINSIEVGGVTSSLRNFCSVVSQNGYEIDLLLMDSKQDCDFLGCRIIKLRGLRREWGIGYKEWCSRSFVRRLFLLPFLLIKHYSNKRGKWLPIIFNGYKLQAKYDAVLAYRQCAPCYYFALNCVQADKKIAFIHGDIDYMGDISSWDIFLSSFDKIACVSNAVREGFSKKYTHLKEHFRTLYNMFDIERLRVQSMAQLEVPVSQKCFNIISITRHENTHKKVNRIIEICDILIKRSITNFHWYIVGDGPDYEKNVTSSLKRGIQGFISFCGAITNPFPLLRQCDLFVLTSLTESYGMVIREAQILKKPVVAARYPSLPEVVESGVDGLIASQTVENMSDKIIRMILNQDNVYSELLGNLQNREYNNDVALRQLKHLME